MDRQLICNLHVHLARIIAEQTTTYSNPRFSLLLFAASTHLQSMPEIAVLRDFCTNAPIVERFAFHWQAEQAYQGPIL